MRVPFCGDGVLSAGETYDEGAFSGTYGHCKADCSGPGPYCGDGNAGTPDEECDDGNTTPGDGCSSGCTMEDTTPPTGDDGGCGCQSTPDAGTPALVLLMMLGFLFVRRRR